TAMGAGGGGATGGADDTGCGSGDDDPAGPGDGGDDPEEGGDEGVTVNLPENITGVLDRLGDGAGASSHPGTAWYPESVRAPAGDPAYGAGSADVPALGDAELETALVDGLAAWRRSGMHGNCAGCHGPDAFDLAAIA